MDRAERSVNAPDPLDVRARFLAAFRTTSPENDPAQRLCQTCVSVLPVARAGISVSVEGVGLEVLRTSDAVAERVEWTQVTLGEGPGVDAIASGGPVVVADLSAPDERWPTFVNEVAGIGVAAMYALPLQVGAIQVGVLDLYRDAPAELAAIDFANAVAVAEMVTATLLSPDRADIPVDSISSLWDQPVGSREVHQATGMIVAQLGVSARHAYVRLQAYAYGHGRLLSEVAHDVVHRRLRFTPESNADPEPDPDPSVTP
ncbi:GAF and ANTAR domain-containing protein [Mycolicibacterium lutetiense]